MKRLLLILLAVFTGLVTVGPASASGEIQIRTAAEYVGGYDRTLFKHWIDADKNGCDTRKEVLIAEAVVKPKKGAKCTLTGGKWISPYDGKPYTKDASLDIDHVVPLAEAWRSGAWAWTSKQRQDFANDLTDSRVLIAVTASANRSKGDRDVKTWLPTKNKCNYIEAWVAVKVRYSLTFDTGEFSVIQSYFTSCPITNVSVDVLPGYETIGNKVAPSPTPTASQTPIVTPSPTVSATPTPTATATPTPSATPTPTPSATRAASPTPEPTVTSSPSPTPVPTVSSSPTPTPTKVKPAPVKYKNCTEAKAAGVTPIRRSTDPELYALNTALDGDKDGDACES
jgi:hypothetical protein